MKIRERPVRSLRFTLGYRGREVHLISRRKIEMAPLPSDPLEQPLTAAGFWYELRDARGSTLFRRVMRNPLRCASKAPRGASEPPWSRERLTASQGIFVVLTPDLEQARTLVLLSSHADSESAGRPVQELAVFDLSQTI